MVGITSNEATGQLVVRGCTKRVASPQIVFLCVLLLFSFLADDST
jgi:hypothetical protein